MDADLKVKSAFIFFLRRKPVGGGEKDPMDEGSHLFGIGRRLVWDRVKRGEHGGGMVGSEHCC